MIRDELFIGPLPEDAYRAVTGEFSLFAQDRVVETMARALYGQKIVRLAWGETQEKLERLKVDATSGLLAKDELAEQAVMKIATFEQGRRRSDKHNSAVLIKFDAENFKDINETYGHPEGDRRIGIIGSYLKGNARLYQGDLIGRLGEGDEFGWLASFDSTETDALTVLNGIENRLLDLVAEQYPDMPSLRWNHAFYCTGDSWEDLLKKADVKGEAKPQTRSHSKTEEENKRALQIALSYSPLLQ